MMQCKPVTKNFLVSKFSNKTHIMVRTRLNLYYNELKTIRLKNPVQSEIHV